MNSLRSLFSCLTPCFDCVEGSSFDNMSYPRFNAVYQPTVRLDVGRMGKNVVILKEGERICGIGGAIATVPIVQNKAYFQATVQQTGTWGIGLGQKQSPFDTIPCTEKFWGIRDNGDIAKENEVIGKMTKTVEEGDVVGVTYDHVELKFYVNGKEVEEGIITGVKGPVYPMVYVDDSAILDLKFKNFTEAPPTGYGEILVEQTIL
uniref:SPRY domain-containing protein 7 n=1 Tax=Caenorhabditis japonica TaxID=281687 RepID=A0A8R1HXZ5_CAEJA